MLDDLLRKTLENTSKEDKENMIKNFKKNIGKLINNINDYIEVEKKIYNAEWKAGYSVSDTPFYSSLYHWINNQLVKEIINAINNVDELEKFKKLEEIEKELITKKEEIEAPNSRWKNANQYKESNNPVLQARINQILENGPIAKEKSINNNINIIINYLKVEEKIYNVEKNAGYIIATIPFYVSTYSAINKLMEKVKIAINDVNESKKIKELRNIEKSILEIRNIIEEKDSHIWKNANEYKEPNNPVLQARINQILENGSLTRQQNFIDEANQEHIPNNSNRSNNFHNTM